MKKVILGIMLLVSCHGMVAAQESKSAKTDPQQLTDARAFLKDLLTGNYAQATGMFDKTASRSISVQQLSGAWLEVLSTAGPFQKLLDYSLGNHGQYVIVDMRCAFANGNLILRLVYDHEQKIAGFHFFPDKKR